MSLVSWSIITVITLKFVRNTVSHNRGQSLCTWNFRSTKSAKRRPKLTHFDMKYFAAHIDCSHINMSIRRHTRSLRNDCLQNNNIACLRGCAPQTFLGVCLVYHA